MALGAAPAMAQSGFEGHTLPSLWDAPRIFHVPFDDQTAALLTIERVHRSAAAEGERVDSPNKAYWLTWRRNESSQAVLEVFNERDQVLRLTWRQVDARYGEPPSWINQKLVYGEIWRGRLFGEAFVFDVEREAFVYREKIVWGQLHFQQWREGCHRFPVTPACAK